MNKQDIENKLKSLPSASNEALKDILTGLYQGKPLFGTGGLLTQLVKDLTQIALQGEMDTHMQDNTLEDAGNRRNGTTSNIVKTPTGSFELEVPRVFN